MAEENKTPWIVACINCAGTGKVHTQGFTDPTEKIERTCPICKGAKVLVNKDLYITELEERSARLVLMMPLFQEARDAITAITLPQARMHNLKLDLAARMDEVGIAESWKALYERIKQK